MSSGKLLVAAIDFGTTFSGYAFQFSYEYEKDPFKIQTNHWIGGGHISLKAPTTVLFNPQGIFQSFGYEAEDKYAELAEDDSHEDWYYFRRFKMLLHENKTLSRSTLLKEEHNKELPAITVFASAIHYLKNHLLETIHKRVADFREENIHWVLTVPAIWNESAKQFMREAAKQAEISSEQLTLALEPEGASVFCKSLPVDRLTVSRASDAEAFKTGSTYMVLDLGGGTVDITVHTVQSDGTLSEVAKSSGGAWGGTQVDAAYLAFLEDIVGTSFLSEFKENNTADFIDMMREFEVKKRSVSNKSSGMITMRVPASLAATYKTEKGVALADKIALTKYAGKVIFKRDKVQIDSETFKQFFEGSVSNSLEHIQEILSETDLQDIDTILLVGGFAESGIVQDRVKGRYSKKKVIIPNESGLVVLKGAVLYGHNPKVVGSRVSKYTYGVELHSTFDEKLHPEKFKFYDSVDGIVKCRYLFEPFVRAGQVVPIDSVIRSKYKTDISDVTDGVGIYASENELPKYVVDPGCFKLGNIYLDEPEHQVEVEMQFGGTEFSVQITDLDTGVKKINCFEFLCH